MDQEQYRRIHHFRQAYLREDGSTVMVDDITFNPAIHSEEPLTYIPVKLKRRRPAE